MKLLLDEALSTEFDLRELFNKIKMEDKTMNSLVRNLKIQYVLFFVFPLLLFILGELFSKDLFLNSPSNSSLTYVLQLLTVVLTMALIPFSLKLFHWVLTKKIDKTKEVQARKQYFLWSGIRLALLEITTLFALVVYFITQSSIGGLCALIAITAAFFCIPSKSRVMQELTEMDNETEEQEENE